METSRSPTTYIGNAGAQKPSLEGWKPNQRANDTASAASQKPSLEGWKLTVHRDNIHVVDTSETFLRGMETLSIFPALARARVLRNLP